MLTFDHVSVSCGKKELLHSVSFGLVPGRITVLLGANGVGKSTLFRCVSGLQSYTGTISLAGQDLKTISPVQRARQVGLLPQILPQTGFPCRTLVSLGRNPYTNAAGRLTDADRAQIEKAMALAGVSEFAKRNADTLSGGERQRVFLAMLLAQDPAVLLLDEPASFLDTAARGQLFALLRNLAVAEGKSVLLVLHDLTEAMETADDVVLLSDRTVFFSGRREDCLESGALEKCFGVQRYFCTNGTDERIFFR